MPNVVNKPVALIVDWGGVLTNGLDHMLTNWTGHENIDLDIYYKVFNDWLGPEAEKELRINPVHALETGQMSVPDFEIHLAEALLTLGGIKVESQGLLKRMFDFFEHAPDMNGLVHRARKRELKQHYFLIHGVTLIQDMVGTTCLTKLLFQEKWE